MSAPFAVCVPRWRHTRAPFRFSGKAARNCPAFQQESHGVALTATRLHSIEARDADHSLAACDSERKERKSGRKIQRLESLSGRECVRLFPRCITRRREERTHPLSLSLVHPLTKSLWLSQENIPSEISVWLAACVCACDGARVRDRMAKQDDTGSVGASERDRRLGPPFSSLSTRFGT